MICKNEKFKITSEFNNYKICECLDCGLIFAQNNNKVLFKKLEVYNNYYKTNKSGRFNGIIEFVVKIFRFKRSLKVYFLNKNYKSILDIGSGRGWMLYFLKKYFKYDRVIGTQISPNAYKFSTEKLKLEIYNKDILDINFERKFDVVSILHVLEHLDNPELYVEKIYETLNDKGILYIEVPNYNSWSRRLFGKHWLAFDLKHHIFFFTPESLTKLLHKYNFKIKTINTFSLEYSTFTSTQSIINLLTNSDSYFFNWLQHNDKNPKIIWHSFLFIIFFFPCFLINIFLYFSKSGEVLTIIAQKNE